MRIAAAVAIGLAGLVFAAPACADVLEVGADGATWVAGAPRQSIAPRPAARPAVSTVTLAAPTATPAEWQPHVAALATKYDLSPSLIEALVWQESRWHTGAVSPKGARGLGQLMPGTARELGVDANDPASNLEGVARYLRAQLDMFGGDVEKALAAYNAGPGRVARANGVPAITETRNYVASIMRRLNRQGQ